MGEKKRGRSRLEIVEKTLQDRQREEGIKETQKPMVTSCVDGYGEVSVQIYLSDALEGWRPGEGALTPELVQGTSSRFSPSALFCLPHENMTIPYHFLTRQRTSVIHLCKTS
jgi:hypothetical protein